MINTQASSSLSDLPPDQWCNMDVIDALTTNQSGFDSLTEQNPLFHTCKVQTHFYQFFFKLFFLVSMHYQSYLHLGYRSE